MKNKRSQSLFFSLASLTFFITPLLGMKRGGNKRKSNKPKVHVFTKRKSNGIQKKPVVHRKRTLDSAPREATNNNIENTLLLITAQRRKINNLRLQIEVNKIEISSEKTKTQYILTKLSRATSLIVEQQQKIKYLSEKLNRAEYNISILIPLTTGVIQYIK